VGTNSKCVDGREQRKTPGNGAVGGKREGTKRTEGTSAEQISRLHGAWFISSFQGKRRPNIQLRLKGGGFFKCLRREKENRVKEERRGVVKNINFDMFAAF